MIVGPHIFGGSPVSRSYIASSASASARRTGSGRAAMKSGTATSVALVLISAMRLLLEGWVKMPQPQRLRKRHTAPRARPFPAPLESAMSDQINRVVLAYSGGLDTSVILKWLQQTYNCEVVTFTADLGQGEELEPARA